MRPRLQSVPAARNPFRPDPVPADPFPPVPIRHCPLATNIRNVSQILREVNKSRSFSLSDVKILPVRQL